MAERLITRTFRKDEEMGFQMLIDGGWSEVPMVPPCPHDPLGEALFRLVMDLAPTNGEFVVSARVTVGKRSLE